MPSAETIFNGAFSGIMVDLSESTEFRLSAYVQVAGHSTAELRVKVGSGAQLSEVSGAGDLAINSVGLVTTAWVSIAPLQRVGSAHLYLYGVGGNATADPEFRHIRMEYR
jgi:hypothetical protein